MSRKRLQQLVQAFHLNDLASVAALLRSGLRADDATPPADDSLLMIAVREERRDMVELLLEHGASITRANAAGETAEGLARDAGPRIATLFGLREPVAAPTVQLFQAADRRASTPFIFESLTGADLHARRHGRTPMLALAAAGAGDRAAYRALLDAGADLAAADDAGDTVLHHFARLGMLDAGTLALPLVHRANARGETALDIVARRGDARFAAMLLDAGATCSRAVVASATGDMRRLLLDRPGVSVLGDLELALRTSWSLSAVAIYADQLLVEGDPRGELIALDLEPKPKSSTWRARRHALLVGWIGSDLANVVHGLIRYGFITHLHDRRAGSHRVAASLLGSPAGMYLRSFSTMGTPSRVHAALYRLAGAYRPFLTEIAVGVSANSWPAKGVTELVANAPSLRVVYAADRPPFAHPLVRVGGDLAVDDEPTALGRLVEAEKLTQVDGGAWR